MAYPKLNTTFFYNIFLGKPRISKYSRTDLCMMTGDLDSLNRRRNGNLVLKAIPLLLAGIGSLGVSWKKRKLTELFRKKTRQQNVITLNQTLLMVFLIMLDNTLPYYFMETRSENDFILEMSRIILFQMIFLKFLIPILLIINSKHNLPELWSETNPKPVPFLMRTPSLVPRPELPRLQGHRELQRKEGPSNVKMMGDDVFCNICNEVANVSMPPVSDS